MAYVRNKSFHVMLWQENNQQRGGVMKRSYCYSGGVYFPVTAHRQMIYSSYTMSSYTNQ